MYWKTSTLDSPKVLSGASIDLMSALKKHQVLLQKEAEKGAGKMPEKLPAKNGIGMFPVEKKREKEERENFCDIRSSRDNFRKMKTCSTDNNHD